MDTCSIPYASTEHIITIGEFRKTLYEISISEDNTKSCIETSLIYNTKDLNDDHTGHSSTIYTHNRIWNRLLAELAEHENFQPIGEEVATH